MIPPTSIDGTDITGATIDGTDVQEITVDGDVVFSAAPPTPSGSVFRTQDDTSTSVTDKRGLKIAVGGSYPEFSTIEAKISANPSGFSRAQVIRLSDGVILDTQNVSGLTAGDVITFSAQLKQNTDYSIIMDNNGSSYTLGFIGLIYPFTDPSIDIDIINGAKGDGTVSGSAASNIVAVGFF